MTDKNFGNSNLKPNGITLSTKWSLKSHEGKLKKKMEKEKKQTNKLKSGESECVYGFSERNKNTNTIEKEILIQAEWVNAFASNIMTECKNYIVAIAGHGS